MLVSHIEILELLRCPKTGSRLEQLGDALIAENGRAYNMVDGYPVLIDYERSIFEPCVCLRSSTNRRSYSKLGDWLKKRISPTKKATAANVYQFVERIRSLNRGARVLIVGGGSIGQGMSKLYEDPDIKIVAFDVFASPFVQFLADAHYIPLPDEYFDGVVVQAVLEHVLEPQRVVEEIHRVLNTNGFVYAETPFLQHVHEGRYDFTRFTESGHRYLFKDYELIESGASAGAGTQLLWSIDYLTRGLFRSRVVGKCFKIAFFWLRYLDRCIPEAYAVDSASGVFFFGQKSDKPISGSEIVAHYRGAQR